MYQVRVPPLVPATTTEEFVNVGKWIRDVMASSGFGRDCGYGEGRGL